MSNSSGELASNETIVLSDSVGSASRTPRLRFPHAVAGYFCAAVDLLVIIASSILGCSIYQAFSSLVVSRLDAFALSGSIAAILYLWMAHAAGFYQFSSIVSSHTGYRKIIIRWLVVGLLLAVLAFLLKVGAIFSRGSILSFVALAATLLPVARWAVTRAIKGVVSEGLLVGRRAVLVGSQDELAALDGEQLLRHFGLSEIDRLTLPSPSLSMMQLNRSELSVLNLAMESARQKGAEEIVLAVSWSEPRRLELVRERMRASPLPVQLLPDQIVRDLTRNLTFAWQPNFAIEIKRGPLSRVEQFLKRGFDVVGALVLLLLLWPPLLIAAIAIKLDSAGPVLFRQRRNGFNVRPFRILKFRTMTVAEDADKVVQATRFDRRVTRVGRHLRRLSVDELPQLFNVLKGDMSLVGPRPHALVHDIQYGEVLSDYAFRHHVKPGITGWAQVNGFRGETRQLEQMQRRVELDLWYINNWSLLLDLKILFRTSIEVASARNAY
ncbi:undecaprenyl-phosphate glucose phosphotransferase [Bradyrhizobium sp. Pa8]|uniref:undecaprenyl-phosphate glucose phosphotransferase n=1 Tax=Bradyrhizobium sp. Pa8 TaxID=3386552 RepID=UPI00403F83CB